MAILKFAGWIEQMTQPKVEVSFRLVDTLTAVLEGPSTLYLVRSEGTDKEQRFQITKAEGEAVFNLLAYLLEYEVIPEETSESSTTETLQ